MLRADGRRSCSPDAGAGCRAAGSYDAAVRRRRPVSRRRARARLPTQQKRIAAAMAASRIIAEMGAAGAAAPDARVPRRGRRAARAAAVVDADRRAMSMLAPFDIGARRHRRVSAARRAARAVAGRRRRRTRADRCCSARSRSRVGALGIALEDAALSSAPDARPMARVAAVRSRRAIGADGRASARVRVDRRDAVRKPAVVRRARLYGAGACSTLSPGCARVVRLRLSVVAQP